MIKQQNKLINVLIDRADHLGFVRKKTKASQVREAIDAITEAVATINENKPDLHNAFYEVEKAAAKTSPEQRQGAPPHDLAKSIAKQEVILRICEEMMASVAKQQEDIHQLKRSQLLPTPTYASIADRLTPSLHITPPDHELGVVDTRSHADFPAPSWTKVERKKANRKALTEKRGTNAREKTKRSLPDAIAIKPGNGECNHDILKSIKDDVDLESIGAHVSSITESRNGEILLKLGSGDSKKTELIEEPKKNLGSRAAIRSLVKYDDIGILELGQRNN